MADRTKLMALALAAAVVALPASEALARRASQGWVTAWSTSQQGQGATKVTNATVRMIARVTIPGDRVRVRLENTFGKEPVTFGKASIGLRARGPALAAGLIMPLTFRGQDSVTIPAGGTVSSDPVALRVEAQQDVAVSLFVAGADAQPSQHNNALVTSYLTDNEAGDQSASEDGKPFTAKTTSMFWLKSIDVHPFTRASAIVAFGDSITDGTCSTLDAHDRWEDLFAQRIALSNPVRRAVINEGIGGNTVTGGDLRPPVNSPPGVDRLDRDVLSHSGVSHVVLFLGTNDIRREVSADGVINGMKSIIARVRSKGIKIIGVTILPRHTIVPGIPDTGWSDGKTKVRNEVNNWIRKHARFDAVLDFDKVMRSRSNPDLLNAAYDCSDGVHPSPYGYYVLGKSVDPRLFGAR
jgi:lysophospholipase L1-like esterase